MPTRYTLELEGLKGAVTNETFTEVSQREDAKKNVKKALEERYSSGKNRWFFTPLSEYMWNVVVGGNGTNSGCRVLSAHGLVLKDNGYEFAEREAMALRICMRRLGSAVNAASLN